MNSLAEHHPHEHSSSEHDTPGGRFSIVARQKRDHERLDQLLDDLAAAPDSVARSRTLGQIARLVFPHAFAEESLLWPVVRRTIPFGEALTAGVEQEHQEVNELWRRLETLHHPDDLDEDHQALLARLAEVLREDVRDEEDRILPRLEENLTPFQLNLLGLGWEVVRRTAPSRPHPVVSRRPPGNALAALPLTVLDRSRDLLDEVSLRSTKLAPGCRRVSARLGEASARVERIGVLRRGERLETRRTPGVGRIRFVGGTPDSTPVGTAPGPA